MNLTMTEHAAEKLTQLMQHPQDLLLVFYDTEGCCGVNGVPTLRFVKNFTDELEEVICDRMSAAVISAQKVFFEKNMKLDFDGNIFRLSSPQGMLNPTISVMEIKKEVMA
ncbi:iron-sulfur cluster biosynthesis family protein [Sediminibacillus massiliensis]|uniref:iron-sulfur cluster biosynthesis family protein n=1 Tax=Sediminibacillus massiliensis TaxID=1926277 RepID=UPI000988478A|nr:iron-sulfur cluster biosynthesis family protein [Sediminibacillus massiliensis]